MLRYKTYRTLKSQFSRLFILQPRSPYDRDLSIIGNSQKFRGTEFLCMASVLVGLVVDGHVDDGGSPWSAYAASRGGVVTIS